MPGDEGAHLLEVLARCGLSSGFVVDIAAGDGVRQSSTLFLFRDIGWDGLAVEMDPMRFRRLAFAYKSFSGVETVMTKVTPDSVVGLLKEKGMPRNFDVLNLDIDSYDLCVVQALLPAFQPLVITMEINEKIPPPVFFTVLYDPTHVWSGDHFYGCSIVAASEVLKTNGYVLESVQYNNAFFIRRDIAEGQITDQQVAEAYERGYLGRADRLDRFPWNRDVEHWQRLAASEVVTAVQRRFQTYDGKFTVELREEAGLQGGSGAIG